MSKPTGKLQQRRTAYHEAGHAVMHVIFYDKILFAQLNEWEAVEGLNGFVRTRDEKPYMVCQHEHQQRRYIESRILIDMAGVVAQYLYPAQKVDWYDLSDLFDMDVQEQSYSGQDFGRVYEQLEILAAEYSSTNDEMFFDSYERFLLATCRHILQQPPIWKAVKTIAEKLLEQRKIEGGEIYDTCYEIEDFEAICDKFRTLYLGM